MNHPLLNPESTHYQMVDGVEAIERLEEMFTVEERMVWAKITAMKYRLRIGHKDAPEKEIVKIKTYEDYYKYLSESGQGSIPSDELIGLKFKYLKTTDNLVDILKYFDDIELRDVNEDLYNICETHKFGCMCSNCFNLNKIDLTLQDRKRRFKADKKEERLKVDKKIFELANGIITFKEFSEYMVKEHPNQTIMSFDVTA